MPYRCIKTALTSTFRGGGGGCRLKKHGKGGWGKSLVRFRVSRCLVRYFQNNLKSKYEHLRKNMTPLTPVFQEISHIELLWSKFFNVYSHEFTANCYKKTILGPTKTVQRHYFIIIIIIILITCNWTTPVVNTV